jgi:hypothetical protein
LNEQAPGTVVVAVAIIVGVGISSADVIAINIIIHIIAHFLSFQF